MGFFAKGLYRLGWRFDEPPPDISPVRVMCSACAHHSAAMAGRWWDRCKSPNADLGSVVRNDETPTCIDMRKSERQCGLTARWFKPRA